MKRRERENEESMPLRNLAHPFLRALRKMCKYIVETKIRMKNDKAKFK